MTDAYDSLDPKELACYAYCDLRKSYGERVSRWRPEALLTAPHTPAEETEALLHEFMTHLRLAEKTVDGTAHMIQGNEPLRCALGSYGKRQRLPSPAVQKRTQEAFDAVKDVMDITRFARRVLRRLLKPCPKVNRPEPDLSLEG